MIVKETKLSGVCVIEIERLEDNRGFFARSYCEDEFARFGLHNDFKQSSISFNNYKGTLRGMHRQLEPYGEIKLVRCLRGSIFDVVIDLRKESETFAQWISIELTQENRKTLYIPKGFAHGFVTLVDKAEVFYQMSEKYNPDAASGVRFNDPMFNIQWPSLGELIISDNDRDWPDFAV